jgi:transposase InsO family protein
MFMEQNGSGKPVTKEEEERLLRRNHSASGRRTDRGIAGRFHQIMYDQSHHESRSLGEHESKSEQTLRVIFQAIPMLTLNSYPTEQD